MGPKSVRNGVHIDISATGQGKIWVLTTQHPNLSFNMEHSGEGQGVSFLDTFVKVERQGSATKLETELHIQPTNSGIILHSTSAHPKNTKHNIIRNMFHRAYNNSSNAQKEKSSINKIWTLLLENGYAPKILERLLREVQRSRAKRGRGDTGQRGRGDAGQRGRVDKGQRRKDDKDRLDSADGFLTLPYIDEQLLRKVKHIVGKSKFRVRIAWRNNSKLKQLS